MSLLIPSQENYTEHAEEIKYLLDSFKDRVDWTIYGSFTSNKVRCWLSDIDVFILSDSDNIIFPLDISKAIWESKKKVELTWIPIQTNLVTKAMMEHTFTHPDSSYLSEVCKWAWSRFSSDNFPDNFESFREPLADEHAMNRFFLRKINHLGVYISDVSEVLLKNKIDLTIHDQKKLWKLWDVYKKVLTLFANSIRLNSRVSLYRKPDQDIVSQFKDEFKLNHIESNIYSKVLINIQDIWDWYDYLLKWWLQEMEIMYEDIFTPFINWIYKELTPENNI